MPIVPFAERIQIVENIKFVDEVEPQTNMNKIEAWRTLKFDMMFVGGDWKETPKWDTLEKEFGEVGVKIIYFPYTEHTSSSKLRSALDSYLFNMN